MDERARWNERYRAGSGPTRVNGRLREYLPLLTRGRALALACGLGQNAPLLHEWDLTLVDLSEEALSRATGQCVQADAAYLPFPPASFDTIVNTSFFDPRVSFHDLLRPGGTVFFETYTLADAKYRPDFCPAHRFDRARIPEVFRGLEILLSIETDDGRRVYASVIARKPG